jgi:hypothetical protein
MAEIHGIYRKKTRLSRPARGPDQYGNAQEKPATARATYLT